MTEQELAKLQVRRANLQEWIALLEAGQWPGDREEVSREAALEHYRAALELVELHLNEEASLGELLKHPLEIWVPCSDDRGPESGASSPRNT